MFILEAHTGENRISSIPAPSGRCKQAKSRIDTTIQQTGCLRSILDLFHHNISPGAMLKTGRLPDSGWDKVLAVGSGFDAIIQNSIKASPQQSAGVSNCALFFEAAARC